MSDIEAFLSPRAIETVIVTWGENGEVKTSATWRSEPPTTPQALVSLHEKEKQDLAETRDLLRTVLIFGREDCYQLVEALRKGQTEVLARTLADGAALSISAVTNFIHLLPLLAKDVREEIKIQRILFLNGL